MKKIAILSGKGLLPFIFKNLAEKKDFTAYTIGVKSITDHRTDFSIPFLGFKEFEEILAKLGNPYIVMLGKFDPIIPLRLNRKSFYILKFFFSKSFRENLKIFNRLKEKIRIFTPEEVAKVYISYLENKGFNFLPSEEIKEIFKPILAPSGILTNTVNIKEKDIKEGKKFFKYAKKIADMDIGQTLIFKEGHIVAIEGLEGTDATIKRACKLVGKGFSVIKVGRTEQDFRIDIPTVGLDTLKLLLKCRVKALFLEAGNVLIIQKEEFIKKASEEGLPIIGLTPH
jgi:DUF1009 family protein